MESHLRHDLIAAYQAESNRMKERHAFRIGLFIPIVAALLFLLILSV
jgi:hypothetical protein